MLPTRNATTKTLLIAAAFLLRAWIDYERLEAQYSSERTTAPVGTRLGAKRFDPGRLTKGQRTIPGADSVQRNVSRTNPDLPDVLVALNREPTVHRAVICRLGASVETWGEALPTRTLPELARELSVPKSALQKARSCLSRARETAREEAANAERLGARLVTRLDTDYPEPLEQLPLAPPVLYVRGSIPASACLSMVGSRACSDYGREAARFFAAQVAAHGVPVVSGMARGIDQFAHQGALEPPCGLTVAILGCGIDVPYPTRSRRLADRMAARGAVVSEFPLGTSPLARNFPVRNRIIAALGDATLVVEAAPRSGSLITARYALELGKEIFALPGRIFDEKSLGTNALLRDGAMPALHPGDILRALGIESLAEESEDCSPPLSEPAASIWRALPRGKARDPEALAAELSLPVPTLLGTLLELELGGWVERFPGPRFCRRTGVRGVRN